MTDIRAWKPEFLSYLNPAPPGLFPYPRPLGGGVMGGVGYDPPAISRTNGRIELREAVFESSPRGLTKAQLRFKIDLNSQPRLI